MVLQVSRFCLMMLTPARLRIHPTQEWHDLYSAEATDDLHRFFDRFLLDRENDWEATPRVRLSLLRYNGPPITSRPERSYPPARVRYRPYYLDAVERCLQIQTPTNTAVTSYRSDSWTDEAHFTLTFDRYTELIGFSKATLFMSSDVADDMDVYVLIRKLDRAGVPLLNYNIPMKDYPPGTQKEDIEDRNLYKYIGPNGCLRASMRACEPDDPTIAPEYQHLVSPAQIFRKYDKVEKIPMGEIIKMEIQLWPGGIAFEAGETLRFEVKGHMITFPENNDMVQKKRAETLNMGKHYIHTGGIYGSNILLPVCD